MKKQIVLLLVFFSIALVGTAYGFYQIGFSKGVEHHTLTQEIYEDKDFYYSDYNGRVDKYYK